MLLYHHLGDLGPSWPPFVILCIISFKRYATHDLVTSEDLAQHYHVIMIIHVRHQDVEAVWMPLVMRLINEVKLLKYAS